MGDRALFCLSLAAFQVKWGSVTLANFSDLLDFVRPPSTQKSHAFYEDSSLIDSLLSTILSKIYFLKHSQGVRSSPNG